MRLKKSPPDESPLHPSRPSSPFNTLRKQRPVDSSPSLSPIDNLGTDPPIQPNRLQKAPPQSAASLSSRPSPPEESPTSASSSEQGSPLPISMPLSSSPPTKATVSTFRGWPIARKPPPSSSRPSSSSSWSPPVLSPSSSAASSAMPSPALSSSMSRSTSSQSSAYSTSSSSGSVTVTAPTVSSFAYPFIPKRPYSAPVNLAPPSSSPNEPARRRTTLGAEASAFEVIPEGIAMGTTQPHPVSYFPESKPEDDRASIGSGRSVMHSVTVVDEPDQFSLHIRLPGFKPNNLLISSRRDRSLLITADRFQDESSRAQPSTSSGPDGHFERCVQFGADADPSRARASFDGDLLTVVVPKRKPWAEVAQLAVPLTSIEKSPRSIALALMRGSSSSGASPETVSDDGSVPSPVSELNSTLEGVRLAEPEDEEMPGQDDFPQLLRSQFGCEEDLVTPTPHRPSTSAAKKDYFAYTPASATPRPKGKSEGQEPPRTREQGMGRSAFFWKKW